MLSMSLAIIPHVCFRATLLEAAKTFVTMSMERGDEEEDGTCRDAYTGTEEVVTAVCIKDFVQAEPALDASGREEISLYEVELMTTIELNKVNGGIGKESRECLVTTTPMIVFLTCR